MALQDALSQIDLLVINKVEASALVPAIAGRIGEGGPPLSADGEEPPTALARQGLTGGGYQLGLRSFFTALRDSRRALRAGDRRRVRLVPRRSRAHPLLPVGEDDGRRHRRRR